MAVSNRTMPERHRGGILSLEGYRRLNMLVSKLIPASHRSESQYVALTLVLDRRTGDIKELGTGHQLHVDYLEEEG